VDARFLVGRDGLMEHDHLAELAGYRNELAQAERSGDDAHAADVRAEIARVTANIARRAEILRAEADGHEASDRYEHAARARQTAKAYEAELGAAEDAAAEPPTDRAVPRRAKKTADAGE
jgi:hypothetical protein